MPAAGRAEAQRVAEAFGRAPIARLTRIERDQWTVAGGFNRHRPLWRAELAGPEGRVLYVAMADPTNLRVVDDLKFRTRSDIYPVIAGEYTSPPAHGPMMTLIGGTTPDASTLRLNTSP